MPFKLDPEVGAAFQDVFGEQGHKPLPVGEWQARRNLIDKTFGGRAPTESKPKDVMVKKLKILIMKPRLTCVKIRPLSLALPSYASTEEA